MNRLHKTLFAGFLLFVSLVPACVGAVETRTVEYVIDGDTIILDGHEKVRLIGVDTPELNDSLRNARNAKRWGADSAVVDDFAYHAKAYTNRMIGGKTVRLEYDWERKDKYGRTLAYVYRLPDNMFLNAEIVRQGYGFAYLRFPFKYAGQFRKFEKEAMKNKRGMWQTGKGKI